MEQRLEVLASFEVEGRNSLTGWDKMLVVRLLDGSMMPKYLPGDLLVFTTDINQQLGKDPLTLGVLRDGRGACFVWEKEDSWAFGNEDYGEFGLPESEDAQEKIYEGIDIYTVVGHIPLGHKGTTLSSQGVADWFREHGSVKERAPRGSELSRALAAGEASDETPDTDGSKFAAHVRGVMGVFQESLAGLRRRRKVAQTKHHRPLTSHPLHSLVSVPISYPIGRNCQAGFTSLYQEFFRIAVASLRKVL